MLNTISLYHHLLYLNVDLFILFMSKLIIVKIKKNVTSYSLKTEKKQNTEEYIYIYIYIYI